MPTGQSLRGILSYVKLSLGRSLGLCDAPPLPLVPWGTIQGIVISHPAEVGSGRVETILTEAWEQEQMC